MPETLEREPPPRVDPETRELEAIRVELRRLHDRLATRWPRPAEPVTTEAQ
jgi:hypothetical protein